MHYADEEVVWHIILSIVRWILNKAFFCFVLLQWVYSCLYIFFRCLYLLANSFYLFILRKNWSSFVMEGLNELIKSMLFVKLYMVLYYLLCLVLWSEVKKSFETEISYMKNGVSKDHVWVKSTIITIMTLTCKQKKKKRKRNIFLF